MTVQAGDPGRSGAAARKDLAALSAMHDRDSFPAEIFGFHAQQAPEKALETLGRACG